MLVVASEVAISDSAAVAQPVAPPALPDAAPTPRQPAGPPLPPDPAALDPGPIEVQPSQPFDPDAPEIENFDAAPAPDQTLLDDAYGLPPGAALRGGAARTRAYIENRPRQVPLERESWLNRPYGASFFLGGYFLDDPLPGVLEGDGGFAYGGRVSWDASARFGVETRFGGASPGTKAVVAPLDMPEAGIFFWDVNWLWYPTGDTRWRPYFTAGTGLLNLDYRDPANRRYHNNTLEVPFGIGMKYRHSTRLAMRFEFLDNYSFASGLQSDLHNLSFTAGLETRFGGGFRRNYYPWNPGRDWW